jgi:hypothetical protein
VHLLTDYKVIIEDADKSKIITSFLGQTLQLMLHIYYFANQTNVGEAEIDAYLQNTSTTRGLPLELAGYGAFMKGTINPMPRMKIFGHQSKLISLWQIYCAAVS